MITIIIISNKDDNNDKFFTASHLFCFELWFIIIIKKKIFCMLMITIKHQKPAIHGSSDPPSFTVL